MTSFTPSTPISPSHPFPLPGFPWSRLPFQNTWQYRLPKKQKSFQGMRRERERERGHHCARWKQEFGVKPSNEPVKQDKQQGKKKSTICHPRKTRYENEVPTFAGKGGIIVVLTKCWTGPKPPSKTCLSKDERNVIEKTHPNPAKDYRACGTHICSPFSDSFLKNSAEAATFAQSVAKGCCEMTRGFERIWQRTQLQGRRKRMRSYPREVIYVIFFL